MVAVDVTNGTLVWSYNTGIIDPHRYNYAGGPVMGPDGKVYYFPDDITDKAVEWLNAVRAQDASITPPLAYGSLKSKLLTCLTNEAHRESCSSAS